MRLENGGGRRQYFKPHLSPPLSEGNLKQFLLLLSCAHTSSCFLYLDTKVSPQPGGMLPGVLIIEKGRSARQ